VQQAEVRRRWPDALDLVLEERVAAARWHRADGEMRLVDVNGEVFATASDQDLPTFTGPDDSAALMLERYREFSALLASGKYKIAAVTLSDRQAWQMTLDDGLIIELGRDEAKLGLRARMQRFATWYPLALKQSYLNHAATVDMRYPNGFAVRLQESERKS
jgi:cell division protein FtsQ